MFYVEIMNLVLMIALNVVLVHSFSENGLTPGLKTMHRHSFGQFATNINVVVIMPTNEQVGGTRLDENETKIALHLALDRIYDEQLIDPEQLRLDETTVTYISDYCDNTKIIKKILDIYNNSQTNSTRKQIPFVVGCFCDTVCWALSSLYRDSMNAPIFTSGCRYATNKAEFSDSGNMIRMAGSGLRMVETLVTFFKTMKSKKKVVIFLTTDMENTLVFSLVKRKIKELKNFTLLAFELMQGCNYVSDRTVNHATSLYITSRNFLHQYKDKANMIILLMPDCVTIQVMKAAFDEGMVKYNFNKHIFITKNFKNVNVDKFLTIERKKIYQSLEGLLTVNQKQPTLLTYHEFVRSMYQYLDRYNSIQLPQFRKNLKGETHLESALLYDSIYLLVKSINKTFKNFEFDHGGMFDYLAQMPTIDAFPFGQTIEPGRSFNLASGRLAFIKNEQRTGLLRDVDFDIMYILKGVLEPMYITLTNEEENFFDYNMAHSVYMVDNPNNDSLLSQRPIKLMKKDGVFRWAGNIKDEFFDVFEAVTNSKRKNLDDDEDLTVILRRIEKKDKRSFGRVFTFVAAIIWIIFWASRILNLDGLSEASSDVEVFKIQWHEISTPDKIDFDEHNVLAQEAKGLITATGGKDGKSQQQEEVFKTSSHSKSETKYHKKTSKKNRSQNTESSSVRNRGFSNNVKNEDEEEDEDVVYYENYSEEKEDGVNDDYYKEGEEEDKIGSDDDDVKEFLSSLRSNECNGSKTVEDLFIENLPKNPMIIDSKMLENHFKNNISLNNINECLAKVNKNTNNYLTNVKSNLERPTTAEKKNINVNATSTGTRAQRLSNVVAKKSKPVEQKYITGKSMALQFYTEVGTYKTQVCSILRINSNINRVNFRNKQFISELKDMANIRHQNLNLFLGVCLEMPNCCLVYLYNKFGSMRDLITETEKHMHSGDNKLAFLLDITIGMEYLHRTVLKYHGHLSSKNLVVDNRWTCKITDYGVPSLQAEKVSQVHKSSDDLLYTAPEILRSVASDKGSVEADIYAFAIITHEIITWDLPYAYERKKKPVSQILKKIEEGDTLLPFRPRLWDLTEGWTNILNSCWNEIPYQRPSFKSLSLEIKRMAKGRTIHRMDVTLEKLHELNNRLQLMVARRAKDLKAKTDEVEALVFNILPLQVARLLLTNKPVDPEEFESSTVYFSDIVGFHKLCKNRDPVEVIQFLNDVFKNFDLITNKYDVFKFGTTRDIYMAVSGAPKVIKHHASEMATMALDMFNLVDQLTVPGTKDNILQLRIGLHTGPVVAGVLGISLPQYCIYGDTVNTASRMQTSGYALKIHLSSFTANKLNKHFDLIYRGVREVKGKGEMETYWLKGKNTIPRMRVPDERLAAPASLHYFK